MKLKSLLAAVLCCLAGWSNLFAALPPAVQAKLEASLPLAFYATPKATRATKVYPLVSQMKRQYTKTMSVNVAEDELVLLAFSPDKKVVNCAYPVGEKGGDYLTGWFKVEDVLDLAQLKLVPPVEVSAPTNGARILLYQPRATAEPELIGCTHLRDGAVKMGERRVKAGKNSRLFDSYNLLLLPETSARGEHQLQGRLVLARELPPFKEEDYRQRVEQLIAEHAYRPGRFWDNGVHPIVVHSGNGGCAAFATDFAGYIFDAPNFNAGERYDDPNEIRSGDVLAFKGHFIAVIERYPDGRLYTMDGNCNSAIRRTSSAYSIVDGKFKGAEFVNGWHYLKKELTPVGKKAKAKK